MSNFNNITSIKSFNDLNSPKINENKDFIILFFYWQQCGACHMAIPIICEVYEKNYNKNYNCKIIKVHTQDINRNNKLKDLYKGGVPAFRVLKHNGKSYDIYNLKNDNYQYSTDGFAGKNYNNNNKNYLSTKNTLIDWINIFSKIPLKEKYSLNNLVYTLDSTRIKEMKKKLYFEKNIDD